MDPIVYLYEGLGAASDRLKGFNDDTVTPKSKNSKIVKTFAAGIYTVFATTTGTPQTGVYKLAIKKVTSSSR